MNIEYWIVLMTVTIGAIILYRRHESSSVLEHPGDCVQVLPDAIMGFDKLPVDISAMPTEPLDRVVRLRMVQIFDAVNDPVKRQRDPSEIIKLKRMATVHSAVTGTSIHKSLLYIDRETKRLFAGVQHRQELVRILPEDVPELIYTRSVQALLRDLSMIDFAMRQEFFYAMGKNEYDYFHVFVTKVRRRIRKHRVESYTDEQIQSCITGYAARLGFQIPRSYVRIDAVTSVIVYWGKAVETNTATNVVRMQR